VPEAEVVSTLFGGKGVKSGASKKQNKEHAPTIPSTFANKPSKKGVATGPASSSSAEKQ
jgi:hypothetical protein